MAGDVFSLTDNPFAQLGLTPRASRDQIVDRAGAGHPLAQLLMDPFARLTEELAWLPGTSGQAAQETVQSLHRRDAAAVAERLLLLRGVAKANLAADSATRFSDPDMVDQLVRAWDTVETADLAGQVNADRMISGFPQVNPAQLGWALQAVRERHGYSVAEVLARSGDGRDRLVRLIERPAPSGHDADLRLIDALVVAYTEQIADALDAKEAKILSEVDVMVRGGRDNTERLESLIEDWKRHHWPALLLASRRGREDARALTLVGDMRVLYLDPSVGPQGLGPAVRIAASIVQAFPSAPAIQRMASSDAARLGGGVLPLPAAHSAPQSPPPAPPQPRREKQPQAKASRVKATAKRVVDQAEAAREALIAQVRARVAAQGQVPHTQPQKKKGGCGWIIGLIVAGFALTCCIDAMDEPDAPSIRAPEVIPAPAPLPEGMIAPPPEEPGASVEDRPRNRTVDNEVGAGAPPDEFVAPGYPDDGSTGGGSER